MNDSKSAKLICGRVAVVALVLGLVFVLLVLANHQWDPHIFATIGQKFDRDDLEDSDWYDGRWFYYIARYPLSAEPYLDAPAYRYHRILYPLIAWIASFGGQPWLLPWVLVAINLICYACVAGQIARFMQEYRALVWYGLVIPLSIGAVFVLRGDMAELLAITLALEGLRLVSQDRILPAAVILALGALAKETALLFAIATVLWLLTQKRGREAVMTAVVAAFPLVVWSIMVGIWMGESGLTTNRTTFEFLPFFGLLFTSPFQAVIMLVIWVVAPTILLSVAAGTRIWRRGFGASGDQSSLFAWCVLVNGLFIAVIPRASYVDVLAMMRLVLGLMVAGLLWVAAVNRRYLIWLAAVWSPSILLALMIPGLIIGP